MILQYLLEKKERERHEDTHAILHSEVNTNTEVLVIGYEAPCLL